MEASAYIKLLETTVRDLTTRCNELVEIVEKQASEITALKARIVELEARLNKNSSNSHKPPSLDGFKINRSLRTSTGRASGGQPGHAGKTLEQVENPNYIVQHTMDQCSSCGHSLEKVKTKKIEKRQVFDIPKPEIEVTEHQVEIKKCPHCHAMNKGVFPAEVKARVQYGKGVLSLGAYLSFYQLVPRARLKEYFQDYAGLSISSATVARAGKWLYGNLQAFEKGLKKALSSGAIIHGDETGSKIDKKIHWLHVASTEKLTLYGTHKKRGIEGIKALGVYENFKGKAIHDGWKSYEQLKTEHGLCNAHHLRELKGIEEDYQEKWAPKMSTLLQAALKEVEKHREEGKMELPQSRIGAIEQEYQCILEEGFAEHAAIPSVPSLTKKRGRKKQSKGKNLLDRLRDHQAETLLFVSDFKIPFTNNQAERDLRMMKGKQKISGTFRSQEGALFFDRVRSYISTAKKQGWNIMEALETAIQGQPFLCNAS